MTHDCGFQKGSWQCHGSHRTAEEKVPPSLLSSALDKPSAVAVKRVTRKQNVSRETLRTKSQTSPPGQQTPDDVKEFVEPTGSKLTAADLMRMLKP